MKKLILIIIIGLLLVNIASAGLLAEKATTKIICSKPEACKIYHWVISPEGSAKNALFSTLPKDVQGNIQKAISLKQDPTATAWNSIKQLIPQDANKAINMVNEFESYVEDFKKIDPSSKDGQAIGDKIEYDEKNKLLTLKNKDGSIFAKIPVDAYEIDQKAKPEDGFAIKVIDAKKSQERPLEISGFAIKNVPKDKIIKLKEEQGETKLILDAGDISYKDKRRVTTNLNNIANAEIKIKDNEISYAKFTSTKAHAAYSFNHKGQVYNFENTFANNGIIEFDSANNKITATNAKITNNNQLINSEFGNANILLNDKGELTKVSFGNCKSGCSYSFQDIKVNSKNDFNLYLNSNMDPKDVTAISVNTIMQKVEKQDIKLTEINSKGEITYSYKDKKIEASKDSATSLVADQDGIFPTLNINKGAARFYNGNYGGIIKSVDGKTKLVRIDQDFLLKQEATTPLFIGQDAVVANGKLGVLNINSYGNKEVKDMFSASNTIDTETFKNLKASKYIENQLDSARNIRKSLDNNVARVDCGLALGIDCPFNVYDKQIKDLEKIYSKLYKGEDFNKILQGSDADPGTKFLLVSYLKGEEPQWDKVAETYIGQKGYEMPATLAREQYYNNIASQIGLDEGLTGKIHRGIETETGLYKPSQFITYPIRKEIPPVAITSVKDLQDLRMLINAGAEYKLSDGTKLNKNSVKLVDDEIKRVMQLEKQNPQLFLQLKKYDSIKKEQYWNKLPTVVAKEAVTLATSEVLTAGVLKGYTLTKGLVKLPAARYAEAYATGNIEKDILQNYNYFGSTNKVKALDNYFLKEGRESNKFITRLDEAAEKDFIERVEKEFQKFRKLPSGSINKIEDIKSKEEILDIFKKDPSLGQSEAGKFIYKNAGRDNFDDGINLLNDMEKQINNINIPELEKVKLRNQIANFKGQIYKVKEEITKSSFEALNPEFKSAINADNVAIKHETKELSYVVNKKLIKIPYDQHFGDSNSLIKKGGSFAIVKNYKIQVFQGDFATLTKNLELNGIKYGKISINGVRIDGRNFFYENGKWILR